MVTNRRDRAVNAEPRERTSRGLAFHASYGNGLRDGGGGREWDCGTAIPRVPRQSDGSRQDTLFFSAGDAAPVNNSVALSVASVTNL